MQAFLDFTLRQINTMVDLVHAPLDRQQRILLGAPLTIDVYARDSTRTTVAKNNISNLSDGQSIAYGCPVVDSAIDEKSPIPLI